MMTKDTALNDIFLRHFRNNPMGFVVTDKAFRILSFNKYAADLLDLPKRKDAKEIRLTDYISKLKDFNENAAPLLGGSLEYTKEDHSYYATPFQVEDLCGVPTGYVVFFRDKNYTLSMSSEFDKSHNTIEELQDIIENSFDGILVTDQDGVIELINRAYEKNTGVNAEEWLGKNINDFVGPSWFKKTVYSLATESGSPVSLQHVCQNNKNIISTGTPVFDKKGNIKKIVINTRDVTEIYSLREELIKAKENERKYYKQLMGEGDGEEENKVVVVSEVMRNIYAKAKHVGGFNATVLIQGPSGSGKEEVAKYIHQNSLRKDAPFITVNCGAIPENLLESELFGYAEGAFTGALRGGKSGLFEMAEGGTLFLDEIGEISPAFQVKLLRALETKTIVKVGTGLSIPVDIRIVAATNRNLEEMAKEGTFREDLLYRLNVIKLEIPPLKGRTDDIEALILKFLNRYNREYNLQKKIPYEVLKELENYSWPGNVRELKNVMESMVILSQNEYLQLSDLPWNSGLPQESAVPGTDAGELPTWKEAIEYEEKKLLEKAKAKYKSSRKMAEALGLDHATVARKIKKYQL